jgi:hypothetical protein
VPASEKPLNIDIPVKLSDVKVVFSIGALEFEGDLPASGLRTQNFGNSKRKPRTVMVHGAAAKL